MDEITIVTAYFNIGREKWKGYERGDNKYVNYFDFWAKIKNNIIVYTDKNLVNKVYEIREKYGLKEKTKVIAINNLYDIDVLLYNRMKEVMENEISLNFHFHKEIKRPEAWNVEYNYVTFLKYYFVNKAVIDFNLNGLVSWLDFGFNHGGDLGLTDTNDFNFCWQYNFSKKIHLFAVKKIEEKRPIFDIIRNLDTYIMGGIMVAPSYMWGDFYNLARQSIISLLDCGFCDDDQTIALMAYYKNPDLFEIHNVEFWFDGIKNFGGEHFKFDKKKRIVNKRYKDYKYRARILLGDGHYKLAWKYYIKYIKIKIKGF
ncbi:WlaTC/HtrL family glycosyltransferase [Megamonas funiformis]|uniref:WlaTC/HtrL family glycosyltransferase n=1 Tax=Megamonas funiformis TaxID=437897 RepID=UPI00259BE0FA|nr:WlaTC/HtrL family glycosyltransferase [Megamonas funiformis]